MRGARAKLEQPWGQGVEGWWRADWLERNPFVLLEKSVLQYPFSL